MAIVFRNRSGANITSRFYTAPVVDSEASSFTFGNALQFDGVNDYVSFSSIPDNSDYSISFWINSGNSWPVNSYKMIFGSTTNNYYIGIRNYLGFARLESFNCVFQNLFTTTTVASINTWYHIVITKSAGVSKFYLNAVFQANGTTSTNTINLLGKYNLGLNLNGKLDETAIWNIELTSTQITNLYNGGNGDFATNYSPANLLAYWRMNGSGTDTTAIDETGNYNGTLNNFPASGMWVSH